MHDIGGETYYSPGDLAKMFNVTVKTMRNYIHRGVLVPDIVTKSANDCIRYSFSQVTVDEFVRQCHMDKHLDDKVLYIGDVAAMCGIQSKSLERYMHNGSLVPDVVLPRRTNGRAGWAKFTQKTAEEFAAKYLRGEFRRGRRKKNV